MAYPEFNGFSLNDLNGTGVITSHTKIKSSPDRTLDNERISRRAGSRVFNEQFGPKTITMSGYVLGASEADLQTKLDAFHNNVTRQLSGEFAISSDRSATAIVRKVTINDNPYNTEYCPIDIELFLPDPFFYGGQQTVTWTVPSGTTSLSKVVSVSGSMYMLPLVTFTNIAGAAVNTTTKSIQIAYASSGEAIVWSGAVGSEFLQYGNSVQFDFSNQLITRDSVTQDARGVFADVEPGDRTLTVTFSGATVGGTLALSYQPRYI